MGSLLRTMKRASGDWKRTPDAWKASGTKPDEVSKGAAIKRVRRLVKRMGGRK